MFERYTEKARRTVFFARYEASQFGSRYIETEHFLLGLLREDTQLRQQISGLVVRKIVEARTQSRPATSTSVDLPLSHETKRVLAYAAEESERMGHKVIDCGHLALGLLRESKCGAAVILRELGLDEERLRASIRMPADKLTLGPGPRRFQTLLATAQDRLADINETEAAEQLPSRPLSRAQALGHLIGLAAAYHGCFVRALVEPRVDAAQLPSEESAAKAGYEQLPWGQLTELCVQLHQLMLQVLARVPPEDWEKPCRIGSGPELTLEELMNEYIALAERMLSEITQA